jgi:hypothetical protein
LPAAYLVPSGAAPCSWIDFCIDFPVVFFDLVQIDFIHCCLPMPSQSKLSRCSYRPLLSSAAASTAGSCCHRLEGFRLPLILLALL